jgi:hypothetical protein
MSQAVSSNTTPASAVIGAAGLAFLWTATFCILTVAVAIATLI